MARGGLLWILSYLAVHRHISHGSCRAVKAKGLFSPGRSQDVRMQPLKRAAPKNIPPSSDFRFLPSRRDEKFKVGGGANLLCAVT